MNSIAELNRRLDNMIRPGTIAEVDHDKALCRVKSGGMLTGWLPWFSRRAGSTRDWDPVTVDEQCLVFSPSGDPAQGFALVGINSTANPAPSNSPTLHRRQYPDGAQIDYDHASHALTASLPGGGTVTLAAPGGVSITGDVDITGNVTVSQDVVASGISLVHHQHTGVTAGQSLTGAPA